MKRVLAGAFLCLVVLSLSADAFAGETVKVNFGLIPLGLMISPDLDGFTAYKSGYYYSATDEVEGSGLYTPGAFFGVDFDPGVSGVGLEVFGSGIVSGAVTGSLFGGNLSYILPHEKRGVARARIKAGVVKGSLDWEGDLTAVRFEDATGWQAGVGVEVGRVVGFYAEALYRSLEFDVDLARSDAVSDPVFDLSGGVINIGVKFSF